MQRALPRWPGLTPLVLLAAAAAAGAGEPEGEVRRLTTTVRYVSGGVVYLAAGDESGVRVGDLVQVTLSGGEELRLRVVATSRSNASAVTESGRSPALLPAGQPVVILVKAAPKPAAEPGAAREGGLWEEARPAWGDDELPPGFRPLLAPVVGGEGTRGREELLRLDGRLTLTGTWFEDREVDRRWSRLRAYLDLETSRLAGSDWRAVIRLSTNGQWERREEDDYQVRLHELYFEHAPQSGGHRVRLGRFFFDPLPSVGQLDGAHGEVRLGQGPMSVGAAAGLLPTLEGEKLDYRRAGGAVYVAWHSDPLQSTGFDGALGYHGTVDDSRFDRSAVMARQELRLFDLVFLSAQEDVDFYDTSDTHSGTRLTRAFFDLRVQPKPWLGIGAGYDRNELVDTWQQRELWDAQLDPRDTLGVRYYVYANQGAPWGLSFSQRLALITRHEQEDQYSLSLSAAKVGIFSPGDSVGVGYTGLFGGFTEVHTPWIELHKQLPAQIDLWFRYRLQAIAPSLGDDLTQHELTTGVSWAVSQLFLQLEGAWTTGDQVDSYRGLASVTWRF